MRSGNRLRRPWLLFRSILPVMVFVLSAVGGYPAVLADLPVRPEPGLPHRPTTTAEVHETGDQKTNGIYLALRVKPVYAVYWSTVEWQDDAGNWHAVEGWTSYVRAGELRWFADRELLGKGPFRWNVFTEEGGKAVTGVPFMLPSQPGATVVTTVTFYPDSTWTATTNYLFD